MRDCIDINISSPFPKNDDLNISYYDLSFVDSNGNVRSVTSMSGVAIEILSSILVDRQQKIGDVSRISVKGYIDNWPW